VPTEGDPSGSDAGFRAADAPTHVASAPADSARNDSARNDAARNDAAPAEIVDTIAWKEQVELWDAPTGALMTQDPTTQIVIDPTGQLAWSQLRDVDSNHVLSNHSGLAETELSTRRYHRRQLRRVALGLVAFTILQALGRVLSAMHVAGGRSATINNLANAFTRPGRASDILQSWLDWDRSPDAIRPYRIAIIAGAWLLVDTLIIIPVVARFLHAWALRRHDALRDDPHVSRAGRRIGRLCRLAAAMCVAFAIAALAANAATAWAIARHGGPRWLLSTLAVATGAKWVFLALIIVAPLGSYLWNWRATASTTRSGWATLMRLRPQLVGVAVALVALVLLPSSVRPQLDDQLRAWWDHPSHAAAAVLGVLVLSALVWLTGSTTLNRADRLAADGKATTSHLGILRVLGALGAAAALVGLGIVASKANDIRSGVLPFVGAVVLVAWVVLSLPAWVSPSMRRFVVERSEPRSHWLVLHALAFAPVLALVLAIVRAVTLAPTLRAVVSASGVLVFVAGIAGRLFRSQRVDQRADGGWAKPLAAFMLAVAVAMSLVWAGRDPIDAGHRLGSVALVMAFAAALVVVLWLVSSATSRPPSGALAFVRVERFPTLSLVAVLLIGANLATTTPGFHRVRLLGETTSNTSPRAEATLEAAFKSFVAAPSGTARPWRPLVLVATAGGGARSAYWTMLTWSCLFGGMEADADQPACREAATDERSVFAASGVSGGAVGLAMEQAAPGAINPDKVFDGTFIESVVANLVSVDAPNALVQSPVFRDRAAVLEQSWENVVPELATRTLFEPRTTAAWQPVMLFDSATTEDGCRFIASPITLGAAKSGDAPTPPSSVGRTCGSLFADELPALSDASTGTSPGVARIPMAATRDARATLCAEQDMRLSTAALLAARFPFVSPTGALPVCGESRFTYLVDGGQVESSGASPVVGMLRELLPRIQAYNRGRPAQCIQPVVMQIDNDYDSLSATDPPSRPKELLAPISGLGKSGERAAAARQQLAELGNELRDLAGCDAAPDLPTYLHIRPRAHPGTQAPLGWSLSGEARDDLRKSFNSTEAQCELLVARAWVNTSPATSTCVTGTVAGPDGVAASGQPVSLAAPNRLTIAATRSDAFGGFHLIGPTDQTAQASLRFVNGNVAVASKPMVISALARGFRLAVTAEQLPTTSIRGGRTHRAAMLWSLGAFVLLGALTVAFSSRRADRDDRKHGALPL
jgi:hypothetical protein